MSTATLASVADWIDTSPSQGKMGATRVFVVDTHPVMAEGLAALIEDQADLTVVGHAVSITDSVARATRVQPDVVLMAGGTGPAVGAAVRWFWPETKLILLTPEDGVSARIAALQAGASSCVQMSCPGEDVLAAIRSVARGQTMFTPQDIAELLAQQRRNESQAARLTAREREVLRLMADGTSSVELACRLGISYTTVRSHIRNLMAKLGAHSRLEAIVKARKLALIR